MTPECKRCGVELTDENWYPSSKIVNNYICAECQRKHARKWREDNPEKLKTQRAKQKQNKKALTAIRAEDDIISDILPIGDLKEIDALVKSGRYLDRRDVLRTALRDIIRKYGE